MLQLIFSQENEAKKQLNQTVINIHKPSGGVQIQCKKLTMTVEFMCPAADLYRALTEREVGPGSGGCLNIKMWYQYSNPYVKDKTVSCDRLIISPVSEGSGDVMVLRRSRPPPAMVLTR